MATGPAGRPYPQGDPGALAGAARRISALATQLGAAAGRLRERSMAYGWRGPTAVLFAPAVKALAGELRAGRSPVRSAGAPVHRLADTLPDPRRRLQPGEGN